MTGNERNTKKDGTKEEENRVSIIRRTQQHLSAFKSVVFLIFSKSWLEGIDRLYLLSKQKNYEKLNEGKRKKKELKSSSSSQNIRIPSLGLTSSRPNRSEKWFRCFEKKKDDGITLRAAIPIFDFDVLYFWLDDGYLTVSCEARTGRVWQSHSWWKAIKLVRFFWRN